MSTFREIILDAKERDVEFDSVIGDVDMPATTVVPDDLVITSYCEEMYGDLLDAQAAWISDSVVEVLYDDYKKGEKFVLSLAGYCAESTYNKLFMK